MKRHTLIFIVLLAAAAAVLTGCGARRTALASIEDPWGVVTVPEDGAVRLLVATALDEDIVGPEGQEQLRGAQLAAADRLIHGFPIVIEEEDAGCDAGRAAGLAVNVTIDKGIAGVIGNTCSPACNAAVSAIESAHYTMVSPGCSASTLVDQVLHVDAFTRTMPDDAAEAELAAEFAYVELGARRAVVVHDGTIETTGLIDAFGAAFGSRGGSVVYTLSIQRSEMSFAQLVVAVAPLEPDVIYAPLLLPGGVQLVQQVNATMLDDTPIVGGRHLNSEWFVQQAGLAAADTYAVAPLARGEAFEGLAEAYAEAYGSPPDGTAFAFGYDAANLLLDAIEEVAVVTLEGELQFGRQALRDALRSTAAHPGATGTLTCSSWGDCSAAEIGVMQVRDRAWKTVYLP